MFCNPNKIRTFVLIVGALLIPGASVYGQNNPTALEPTGAVILLDSTRERDGLFGSVRRVKVQTAKLETKSGQSVEGPLQLLEITTYSLSGNRIENVSYPVTMSTVGKEEYKYDDKGNIIEMTLRGDDGAILSREKYDYEFDTFGNWTKMLTSLVVFEAGELKSEPVEVTYRSLAYYFNDSIAQIVRSGSAVVSPAEATKDTAISSAAGVEVPANQLLLRGQPASSDEIGMKALPGVKPGETKESVSPAREDLEYRDESSVPPAPTPDPSLDDPSANPRGSAFSRRKDIEPDATPVERKTGMATNYSVEAENASANIPEVNPNNARRVSAEPEDVSADVPDADPKNSTPNVSAERIKALEYYRTGRQHFDSGALKEAIDDYQQSIELEPEFAEVHLSLGQANLRLKQNQQAIKSFKQATVLEPEMAEAFYGLGLSYFSLSRNKEAAKAFKQATIVRPDLAKAHFGLALAYQELGDEEAVVTQFRILETLDGGLAKKLAATFPEFNLPCRVPPYCK